MTDEVNKKIVSDNLPSEGAMQKNTANGAFLVLALPG